LPEQQRFEAKITWPDDAYAAAQVSNLFVVTDDGTGVYIAFGYIPPFPGAPPEVLETVTPRIQSSVFVNHANAKQLAEVLNKSQHYERRLSREAQRNDHPGRRDHFRSTGESN
jgi:hypothetical protein